VTRVAFQGELGAYSEEAVVRLFGEGATPVPCRENRDVTRAIAAGDAESVVLPLENSLAGTVAASYDAMLEERGLFATSELTLPIHHCLLAPAGARLADLRDVESHPVALAQCRGFFERHAQLAPRAAYDTAGAARDVAAAGDRTRAAIAGRPAARRYGLEILAADIEDRGDNRTRFVAIGRVPATLAAGTRARTLLLVTTDNVPGALLRVLRPLADRALNMTKLESRPTGEPWSYRFVVEFEHAAGDPSVREVVAEIGAHTLRCESLGTVGLVPGE
jgi:prephenate dehydratase